MTKSIEDALNLPRLEDALLEAAAARDAQDPTEALSDTSEGVSDDSVVKMANALQNVSTADLVSQDPLGTQDHVMETEEIYEQAMRAHKDLLDLGFNIEPKHAGANAFTPAMKALEIALKASQSRATKKMERIKLIMDQEKHSREMNQDVEDGEIVDNGGASITANRNDLMAKMRKGEI